MRSIKETDHITPLALAPRPLRNCPPSFSLQTSMRELPFITACAFAIVMLLVPAAWHVRSRNSGIILYIAWSLTGNVIYFVNSIIWAGNLRNPSPIWCDICMFQKPTCFRCTAKKTIFSLETDRRPYCWPSLRISVHPTASVPVIACETGILQSSRRKPVFLRFNICRAYRIISVYGPSSLISS